jgi:hypothetical protein
VSHDRKGRELLTIPADRQEAEAVLNGKRHLADVSRGWVTVKYNRRDRCYDFMDAPTTPPAEPLSKRQADAALRYMRAHNLSGESGWRRAEKYARSR